MKNNCNYIKLGGGSCHREAMSDRGLCIFHEDMAYKKAPEVIKAFRKEIEEGEGDFEGCILPAIDLSSAKIPNTVFFTRATIKGAAIFKEASMGGSVFFERASIEGSITFERASIEGSITFERASIDGETSFSETLIGGGAVLNRVSIAGSVWFNAASIRDELSFIEAKIDGDVRLDSAEIRKSIDFEGARIIGHASFESAKIDGDVRLASAEIAGTSIFDNAEITGRIFVNKETTKISGIDRFDNVSNGETSGFGKREEAIDTSEFLGAWITVGEQAQSPNQDILDFSEGDVVDWPVPIGCTINDRVFMWVTEAPGFLYVLKMVDMHRGTERERDSVQAWLEIIRKFERPITFEMLKNDNILAEWDIVNLVENDTRDVIRKQSASMTDSPEIWDAFEKLCLKHNPDLSKVFREITPPPPEIENQAEWLPDEAENPPPESESQVEWLPDEAAKQDMLNRQALAKALATRLIKLRDDQDFKGMSFLIHVDGHWGSGKTTLMNLLQKELESEGHPSEWLFVKFDAWRQSHVGPPWWALLTQLRQSISAGKTWKQQLQLWWAEFRERIRCLGPRYLVALILTVLVVGILSLLYIFPKDFSWESLEENIGGLTAVAGIVVAIWGGAMLIAKFAFWNSATGANFFERSHKNPMQEVSTHFDWLMSYSEKTIVFLIDDLDRCPSTYVVGLLDSIQTLMRKAEKEETVPRPLPAYFVVAADGRWIRKSYDTAYKDFAGAVDEPGRPLGYLFLDKLFQLTVRVPLLSNELKETFLQKLLQVRSEGISNELKQEVADANNKIEQSPNQEAAEKVFQEVNPEVKGIVVPKLIEKLNSVEFYETEKHSLEKFYKLLDPNPRSMKRFIMAHSLARSITLLEGNYWVRSDTIALWTILQLRWPELAERLRRNPDEVKYVFSPDDIPKDDKLRAVFTDDEVINVVKSPNGGPLSAGLIKACCVRGRVG